MANSVQAKIESDDYPRHLLLQDRRKEIHRELLSLIDRSQRRKNIHCLLQNDSNDDLPFRRR